METRQQQNETRRETMTQMKQQQTTANNSKQQQTTADAAQIIENKINQETDKLRSRLSGGLAGPVNPRQEAVKIRSDIRKLENAAMIIADILAD
jgi:hypothetical protein